MKVSLTVFWPKATWLLLVGYIVTYSQEQWSAATRHRSPRDRSTRHPLSRHACSMLISMRNAIIRRHCWWFPESDFSYMLPLRGRLSLCQSDCHVRALCSNGRRYRHDFFCIRQPHVSPGSIKIWLTLVNPFLPKFAPKWPPCRFDRRRHSMANCSQMVRDSAMVTMECPWNHHRSFECTIPDPTTSPSPKWGPRCISGLTSRRVLPSW